MTNSSCTKKCPSCGVENHGGTLFCESCGYDFTTGTLPRESAKILDLDAPLAGPATVAEPLEAPGPLPGPVESPEPLAEPVPAEAPSIHAANVEAPLPVAERVEWVAEVWVDPDWYAVQQADDPMPPTGLPEIVGLRKREVLIGRPSRSRGIEPEIDAHQDTSCSRRQAQLSFDGTRWYVEDLDSANGTYVGAPGAPMPEHPIPRGRIALADGDRVYVGAWTRVVVRRATPEESDALA